MYNTKQKTTPSHLNFMHKLFKQRYSARLSFYYAPLINSPLQICYNSLMDIFDIIGWVGMVLVLAAYLLLSLGKIKNGYIYQFLNLAAGALMAIGLYPKNAWFSFTLQIVWALIAVISIIKLKTTPKKKKK